MLITTKKKPVFKCAACLAALCFSLFVGSNATAVDISSPVKASWSSQTHMNLGHWRHSIAERINPNFYSDLKSSNFQAVAADLSYQGAKFYFNADRFQQLNQLIDGKNYFFTFDYDERILQPVNFYDSTFKVDQLLVNKDSFSRSYIAPGIAYRVNDNTAYNLAVVFAQQNYNDINFLASEITGPDQLDLYAVSYNETSNGLGLNLGMSQKLFSWLSVETQYQSKIDMDGFSRLVGVQADPADFDIPEHLSMSVGVQLSERNALRLNAKHSIYQDINAFVSRSFPDIFLTFLNDMESPEFQWDNQTMYSIALEHQFKGGAVVNVEYSGRQQPPATDKNLTTILNAISAEYSVRVGLSTPMFGGQLDMYGSYAPKPLNFGRTDFGQVDDVLKGKHTEAVVSWLYTF
ncbi:hypothetical protein [Marinicella rhabdoformis]|uniref:hypothetical protein n=1 Tax=Marinicella rhabdoformis TaxID=2580566 RepID=UPI0012AEDA17|nr:hypothetical protein [Marinicella rhabdoformis]